MKPTNLEYERLHRRCMNQRRELRRLNRKIQNLELYIEARLHPVHAEHALNGFSARSVAEQYHRSKEDKRKLAQAYSRIAELSGKREAAE